MLLAAALKNHLISFIVAAEIFPDVRVGTLCAQQLGALGSFPGVEVDGGACLSGQWCRSTFVRPAERL